MPVAESCKDETVLGYVGRDSVLKLRSGFLIADGAGEELARRDCLRVSRVLAFER